MKVCFIELRLFLTEKFCPIQLKSLKKYTNEDKICHIASGFYGKKEGDTFLDDKYSRSHKWIFNCGIELDASSSPQVVPPPMSNKNAVDPEEAFVAALSSCHMLWFLSIAVENNFIVKSYEDNASGILRKNEEGKIAMTNVTLNPKVIFSGDNNPDQE